MAALCCVQESRHEKAGKDHRVGLAGAVPAVGRRALSACPHDAGLAARGLLQLDALGDQQAIAAHVCGAGACLGARIAGNRHRLTVVFLTGDPLNRTEDLVVEIGQLRLVDQSHRTGLEVFGEVFLVQVGVEAVTTASGEQGCRQQV